MNKSALELLRVEHVETYRRLPTWTELERVAQAARAEMRERAALEVEGPACVEQPCKHIWCAELALEAKYIRHIPTESGK